MVLKRIKARFSGWERQPSKKEILELTDRYGNLAAGHPEIPGIMLLDLTRISRYADFGEMRAVKYAYALGFRDGMGGGL